jgi:para-nitrobenzyl esterase
MNVKLNSSTTGVRHRAGIATATAVAVAALAATTSSAFAGPSSAAINSTSVAPVVAAPAGTVRGKTVAGVQEFLGIPYAKPPVGRLRWRAPQPAVRWAGVRNAREYGANCPQPATPFGVASTNENCLYLNVYAPAKHHARRTGRPVLVWIHGGGLWLGEGNDYDPRQLAAKGTIVVTINYRLGALGFLAHPALAGRPGGSSGNYGLMDQQAALRWVKHNIRQFGGDPTNVTIAGESAGGTAVLAQVASPGARGLFERAVVQSGDFALKQTPLATAEKAGETFATKAGCADQTAACLRALPASAIVANETQTGYVPAVIDGKVLKQSIGSALASGHFNRVPMINGTNHDEERLFVALGLSINQGHTVPLSAPITATNYQYTIASTLQVSASTAASIATRYPLSHYPSPAIAYSALDTDANFACPALTVDRATAKYVPTFAYEFNDENAPERFIAPVKPAGSFPFGAAHESELQYLFGLPTAQVPGTLTSQQQQLSTSMQHYWTTFAAKGSPSSAGQPLWPTVTSRSQQMLSLVAPRPHTETNFGAAHQCAFWSSID